MLSTLSTRLMINHDTATPCVVAQNHLSSSLQQPHEINDSPVLSPLDDYRSLVLEMAKRETMLESNNPNKRRFCEEILYTTQNTKGNHSAVKQIDISGVLLITAKKNVSSSPFWYYNTRPKRSRSMQYDLLMNADCVYKNMLHQTSSSYQGTNTAVIITDDDNDDDEVEPTKKTKQGSDIAAVISG
mmetsp:Transcript_10320/g.15172  ORF Transcript_10320/g.15172 Transcript_10320/m.15172 type:complete len:186 (+) Transcript_10320:32-589(+)